MRLVREQRGSARTRFEQTLVRPFRGRKSILHGKQRIRRLNNRGRPNIRQRPVQVPGGL